MSRKEKRRNNSKIILLIIIVLVIVAAVGVTLQMMKGEDNKLAVSKDTEQTNPEVEQEQKNVKIYSGKDRPIAVMIDNNTNAWPQAGLNDAYMVYEIIVEGGETRLMALFKNVNLEKIGPVRSSRHYFLDYAMENDAIYAHYGWSPQAQSDISTYGINNINGIYEESTYWRDSAKVSPHNAVTSTKKLLETASKKGYRTTSDSASVLKYTTEEVNLEDGQVATDVKIPYNSGNLVEYKYNEETKTYTRYSKGKKQTEWNTGKDVTTKNIIITFAKNYTLADGENKGRQGLNNTGSLKGYYITNGKVIEITCNKENRKSKTIYKDLQGNEIKINDGNTFVQICPSNANVTFEK